MDDELQATLSKIYGSESAVRKPTNSTGEKVATLLNEIPLHTTAKESIATLAMVKELLIHKDPDLLTEHLPDILGLQHSRSSDFKKHLLNFIVEVCTCRHACLPRCVFCVTTMLQEPHTEVVKRSLGSLAELYKLCLKWMATAEVVTPEMQQTWIILQNCRVKVAEMLQVVQEERVQLEAIKFLHKIILVLSRRKHQKTESGKVDFCLDFVSERHPLLKVQLLQEDGRHHFKELSLILTNPTTKSVVQQSALDSLMYINKSRAGFLNSLIEAITVVFTTDAIQLQDKTVAEKKKLSYSLTTLINQSSNAEQVAKLKQIQSQLSTNRNSTPTK